MAGQYNRISSKPSDPFDEDGDDIDDFEFVSSGRSYQGHSTHDEDLYNMKREQLFDERQAIQENTVMMSQRSLGILHESEQVGIATAEELMQQREQLENVDRKLDQINHATKISQKHLNSIKSVFGGLVNYFKGNKEDESVKTPDALTKPTRLQESLTISKSSAPPPDPHPGMRVRDLDVYDAETASSSGYSSFGASQTYKRPVHDDYEDRLEKNLDLMSSGMSRLKLLAVGLNDELDSQNELLDRIDNKTVRADDTIKHQNRQMRDILKIK